MRSPSSQWAKRMVVMGLKYIQLVATTASSFFITQFHIRKHAIDATTPRKSRLPVTAAVNTSCALAPRGANIHASSGQKR